jgi:hypothetical protein
MFPSQHTYSALGFVYDRLGSRGNAENCLIQASMITPNKFCPKLMLMQYYKHIYDFINASKIAEDILLMKIKVPSMEVNLVKKLAKKNLQSEH